MTPLSLSGAAPAPEGRLILDEDVLVNAERHPGHGHRRNLVQVGIEICILMCLQLKVLSSAPPVRVSTMDHGDNRHTARLSIDAIDHPIRSPSGAVPVIKRWLKPLADTIGVLQQRANDELVSSERNRLGQLLGQLATRGRGDDELVGLIDHADARRWRIASLSISSLSPSPRANSASDAANC